MKKTTTPSEVKTRASKLRDILDNHGHQLKHTESLEVVSKLEGASDWNTYSAHLKVLERIQEVGIPRSRPLRMINEKHQMKIDFFIVVFAINLNMRYVN